MYDEMALLSSWDFKLPAGKVVRAVKGDIEPLVTSKRRLRWLRDLDGCAWVIPGTSFISRYQLKHIA